MGKVGLLRVVESNVVERIELCHGKGVEVLCSNASIEIWEGSGPRRY